MKFDTLRCTDQKPSGMWQLLFFGALVIGAIWAFHMFYVAVLFPHRVVLIEAILSLPFIWLLGHVVVQTFAEPDECGCDSTYRYFWTEWLHKRKCLAYTLNK